MFKTTTLTNGIRVVTAKLPSRTLQSIVFTNIGSRFETKEENGLSHFLEHMVFKGTTTRDAKTLSQTVELLGSDFNAYTSRAVTAYMVTGLSENVATGLEILADIMQNSTFDPEELEREKDVVIQEIHQYDDDIGSVAYYAFGATAYADQPLGRSILGPVENIESFTREMVDRYFKDHYHAGEIIVTGVGDVDHDSYVEMVAKHFGDMPGGTPNVYEKPVYTGGTNILSDDRFDQCHVHIGFEGPGFNRPHDNAVARLLGVIIGGGQSSPLFQEVREKLGLCYAVWAELESYNDTALFSLGGMTTPENLQPFLTKSIEQLVLVAQGQVDPQDFTRAVNTVLRSVAQRDEKALTIAQYAAQNLFREGVITTTDELLERYKSITVNEVVNMAQTLIKSKPTIALAGNIDEAVDYASMIIEVLEA